MVVTFLSAFVKERRGRSDGSRINFRRNRDIIG